MERNLTYFVSDVHLGLDVNDMKGREARFVRFLRSIPSDRTDSLYLLGDIWDFWHEYHDVAPTGYARVFSSIMDLIDAGVKVYFFRGNHDIWISHYFESIGIRILEQPYEVTIGGKKFCLGHGDGLGPGMYTYKVMRWCFRAKVFQFLFSLVHPWLAYRMGKGWSKSSRLSRDIEYAFKGKEEPLFKWCESYSSKDIDFFIFGHYHAMADETLSAGARLLILKDWMKSSPYIRFDSATGILGYCPNME